MSGAGKTTTLKIFEDAGYHCVDNLPPPLIGQFADILISRELGITQVALGIDIRGGKLFAEFFQGLLELNNKGIHFSILFLDSSNDVLLNRYKETRHMHPLAKNDLVSIGIAKERVILEDIKEKSTYIIDTSQLLPKQLKSQILNIFGNETNSRLMVNIQSFGYKYGLPEESDLVFDVRFLPNPFYNSVLKPFSGLDKQVQDYVLSHDVSIRFIESLTNMINFLLPFYTAEGKSQLVISIGCTGGRHRSVTLAEELNHILVLQNQPTTIFHRDIEKYK